MTTSRFKKRATHLVTFVFEDGTKSVPMKCTLKNQKLKKLQDEKNKNKTRRNICN